MHPTITVNQSVFNTSATKSVAISWNTGDLVIVIGSSEDNSTGSGSDIHTPTVTGLTFSAIDTDTLTAMGTHCWGGSWQATAASSGSGNVSAVTTGGSGGNHFGIIVVVVSAGTYGSVGTHTRINDTSETASVTLNGPNSAVLEVITDYSAGPTAGYTYTPSGATEAGTAVQDPTHYTAYAATWNNQSAGTASYGVNVTSSGGQYTKIIVEVTGTSAAASLAWIAGVNHP